MRRPRWWFPEYIVLSCIVPTTVRKCRWLELSINLAIRRSMPVKRMYSYKFIKLFKFTTVRRSQEHLFKFNFISRQISHPASFVGPEFNEMFLYFKCVWGKTIDIGGSVYMQRIITSCDIWTVRISLHLPRVYLPDSSLHITTFRGRDEHVLELSIKRLDASLRTPTSACL